MHKMTTHHPVDIKSFLGLRKITVVYVLVLLLALTWGSTLYQIYQIQHLAERNSTAVRALCIFRSDLIQRRDNTERFIDLSPRQRKQKYGEFANIPIATLKTQIKSQTAIINSLDSLRCH